MHETMLVQDRRALAAGGLSPASGRGFPTLLLLHHFLRPVEARFLLFPRMGEEVAARRNKFAARLRLGVRGAAGGFHIREAIAGVAFGAPEAQPTSASTWSPVHSSARQGIPRCARRSHYAFDDTKLRLERRFEIADPLR